MLMILVNNGICMTFFLADMQEYYNCRWTIWNSDTMLNKRMLGSFSWRSLLGSLLQLGLCFAWLRRPSHFLRCNTWRFTACGRKIKANIIHYLHINAAVTVFWKASIASYLRIHVSTLKCNFHIILLWFISPIGFVLFMVVCFHFLYLIYMFSGAL